MRLPTLKEIIVNVVVLLSLLIALEGLARLVILIKIGDSTAGLNEKRQYLKYQPFTMYGPVWDEKIANAATKRYFDGGCRVVLIGGSTAEGWSPKNIEEALGRVSKSKALRVINLGVGGYNSRQQAVVAALWLPKLKPHLVITLDGANDIIHRPRMNKGGAFYLDDSYRLFLSAPYLAPILETLIRSQLYNSISSLRRRHNFEDKKEYADLVGFYMDAQKSIDIIARGVGSRPMYVLQPFHAFKASQSPEEESFTHYDYRKAYVSRYYGILAGELRALSRETKNAFVDSRNIFSGYSQHAFTDDVHLTKFGYKVLGDAVADSVLKQNALYNCSMPNSD